MPRDTFSIFGSLKRRPVALASGVLVLLVGSGDSTVESCCATQQGCLNPPEGYCQIVCDTLLDTDLIYDGSCGLNCCETGVCYTKDRNEGDPGCPYTGCYNNDFKQCTGINCSYS